MKRYLVLGLGVVLAVSLSVPALGGPSNPVANGAASAKKIANKALKKAKKANQKAAAAQTSADAAQASADGAQASADSALAEAADVSANDLNLSFVSQSSASDSTTPKSINANCPAGKEPVGAIGSLNFIGISVPDNTRLIGTNYYISMTTFGDEVGAGTGSNWYVSGQTFCVRSSG